MEHIIDIHPNLEKAQTTESLASKTKSFISKHKYIFALLIIAVLAFIVVLGFLTYRHKKDKKIKEVYKNRHEEAIDVAKNGGLTGLMDKLKNIITGKKVEFTEDKQTDESIKEEISKRATSSYSSESSQSPQSSQSQHDNYNQNNDNEEEDEDEDNDVDDEEGDGNEESSKDRVVELNEEHLVDVNQMTETKEAKLNSNGSNVLDQL
jgi:type II secretory pathway pseudopilin PulG